MCVLVRTSPMTHLPTLGARMRARHPIASSLLSLQLPGSSASPRGGGGGRVERKGTGRVPSSAIPPKSPCALFQTSLTDLFPSFPTHFSRPSQNCLALPPSTMCFWALPKDQWTTTRCLGPTSALVGARSILIILTSPGPTNQWAGKVHGLLQPKIEKQKQKEREKQTLLK